MVHLYIYAKLFERLKNIIFSVKKTGAHDMVPLNEESDVKSRVVACFLHDRPILFWWLSCAPGGLAEQALAIPCLLGFASKAITWHFHNYS